jgi:hypothetical protein
VYKQEKLIGGFTRPRSYRGMYGQMGSHWFHVPKNSFYAKIERKFQIFRYFMMFLILFNNTKPPLPEKSHAIQKIELIFEAVN